MFCWIMAAFLYFDFILIFYFLVWESVLMSVNAKKVFIRVSLSEGMFSSEYLAKLKLIDGKEVSLFVDHLLIKKLGKKYFLRATLINKCPKLGYIKALLPSNAFGIDSRWVVVSKNCVEEVVGSNSHDSEQHRNSQLFEK